MLDSILNVVSLEAKLNHLDQYGRRNKNKKSKKELRDLFPDFVFSNDEESISHAKHDVVNVSSNSGTV